MKFTNKLKSIFITMTSIDSIVTEKIEEFHKKYLDKTETLNKTVLDKIEEISYQNAVPFDKNIQAAEKLSSSLDAVQSSIEGYLAKLKKFSDLQEKLVSERQKAGNLSRDIEQWKDCAVEFLEDMERALEGFQKTEKKDGIEAIEQAVKNFSKLINPLGLRIRNPAKGDAKISSDDYSEEHSEELEEGCIIECKKWGFEINGELYKNKKATVVVSKGVAIGELDKSNDSSSNALNKTGEAVVVPKGVTTSELDKSNDPSSNALNKTGEDID
jgi:hypothetical protein